MGPEFEITVIAVVTAVACALPGTFLVLRRMALVSDAISHAILPGIVVGFLLTGNLSSPLLVVAAAATGVFTVALIEALGRTRLVREDSAIALVFPALFSIGVVMIARFTGNVHIDVDSVLLGELAFAPFDRVTVFGADLGPAALWTMAVILLSNLGFVLVLFKELKLTTIDSHLAAVLGFRPVLVHYLLMGLVSMTAVGAFNAAGSILVVALMIAPPATAYLLVERFPAMLFASAVIAALGALLGCRAAFVFDVSIAGSMALALGVIFAAALLFAPRRGLVSQMRRRAGQKLEFSLRMLLVHLLHHEGLEEEAEECARSGLHHHLRWSPNHVNQVVRRAVQRGFVEEVGDLLRLSSDGRCLAEGAILGGSAEEAPASGVRAPGV